MLKEMAIFSEVVDCGGFSAAARKLGLTTSAVSRHVSRLELFLGGRLLQRSTRAMALTEMGERVHAACLRMLVSAREVQALASDYSARPNGTVRVSAPVAFGQIWLAPRLPAFLDRYPDINLSLTLVDRKVDLIEDGVDLAIRIAADLAPGLAARRLCPIAFILVATSAYLAAHRTPEVPADLHQHRCFYLGYGEFDGRWTLRRGEEQARIELASRATFNNSAAIMAAVEADGGIGLVPDFAGAAALADGRCQRLLPAWTVVTPSVGAAHAIYTPGRHLALKTRVLIDFLSAG